MNVRRLKPVETYVAVVSVAGLAVLLGLALAGGGIDVRSGPAGVGGFWLFCIFVVIGELFPITVPRRQEAEEITPSTTFAFAMMLGYGTLAGVASLVVGSLVADLVHRKPVWKALFNLAQYAISLAFAAGVYHWLGGVGPLSAEHVGAVVAAAVTFFILNDVLAGAAVGLAQGSSLPRYLGRDLVFQGSTAAALLALSPIVVVAAERSLWLVPLLAVPVAAVYWGAKVSLDNTRLVAQLEGSLAHMTELNRLKDDFVAVVSHELRTPLTSIQGYIKTMLQLAKDLGEEQRRSFLEAADRQGDRLRRLIEQLLVVARLESHVEPLTFTLVSVGALTKGVVDDLRPRAHGHTFDLRFEPGVELVETDEAKLHQILSNLIENSLKYSAPDTRVTVRGVATDSGVVISVEDEGPGIPPDSHDKVFDRFFQVDQSITRSVGGTGLGLYICRKMAETIGARLWLERSTPEGSVFALWIPSEPPGGDNGSPNDLSPAEKRLVAAISR